MKKATQTVDLWVVLNAFQQQQCLMSFQWSVSMIFDSFVVFCPWSSECFVRVFIGS